MGTSCPHCCQHDKKEEESTSPEHKHLDPVCGMTVSSDSPYKTEYQGKMWYFCRQGCLDKFTADPEKYLSKDSKQAEEAIPGAMYICPMDPEIRQDHPGACPICGMALEPEIPTLSDEEDPELVDFRRRFFVTLPFTVIVFCLAMSEHLGSSLLSSIPPEISSIIQLVGTLPLVLWAGIPFFVRCIRSIITLAPNMWTLIGMGTGVAFIYSLVANFFPEIFPSEFLHNGSLPVYYEASAVIISLSLLGQIMELKARARTAESIKSLLKLTPETANLIKEDGSDESISLDKVKHGDKLRVRPGGTVPVDGVLLEGFAEVDESMLTGEPLTVSKQQGAKLIGGTINSTGSFIMEATQVGSDTMLSRIVQLVVQAQRSRAPIQHMADKFAKYFVVTVVLVALLTFFIWGYYDLWNFGIANAVSVLIIACPCALGLATPMSIMVASGKAATVGVLFRDAAAIEELSHVDILVMDKTGTLTEGKPTFQELQPEPGFEEGRLLYLAASLEQGSEHPLGRAIVNEAKLREYMLDSARDFQAHPGGGITGTIDNEPLILGSSRFLMEQGINTKVMEEKEDNLRERGDGVVFLCVKGALAGTIILRDKVKSNAQDTIKDLIHSGLKIAVASGDADKTVRLVAQSLGIESAHGGLTPEGKLNFINELRSRGSNVAMAGDGINDAPALAAANVGIAMGTGTDAAMLNSGVTLLKGDLTGISRAIKLSKFTMSNMRGNLFLAFAYNSIGIPLAAGILYPVCGLLLSPMIAALAMCLSSVSVIMNALRLRRAKI